jgi:hypothetical protein
MVRLPFLVGTYAVRMALADYGQLENPIGTLALAITTELRKGPSGSSQS